MSWAVSWVNISPGHWTNEEPKKKPTKLYSFRKSRKAAAHEPRNHSTCYIYARRMPSNAKQSSKCVHWNKKILTQFSITVFVYTLHNCTLVIGCNPPSVKSFLFVLMPCSFTKTKNSATNTLNDRLVSCVSLTRTITGYENHMSAHCARIESNR